ncbi:MAG: nucleotide exchange factor GrpE [Alphaproteobacteria bacterium]|nr:nucleotide exchange factor GrpE [Alphaproteobacteria bacterium]
MTEAQKQEMPETETENAADAGAPDTAMTDAARIAELERQVAELKDRALREMADAENTRRRAQKEREETSKYAVANFAKEMLNVSDNFVRALEAAPKDSADAGVKNLIAGIEATERQLANTLAQFGIKKIDPVGQPFDPNFHRAMAEIESADHPPGTVVQVMQAGYVIHDRLLREALVAVSKGSPAAAPHVDTTA